MVKLGDRKNCNWSFTLGSKVPIDAKPAHKQSPKQEPDNNKPKAKKGIFLSLTQTQKKQLVVIQK